MHGTQSYPARGKCRIRLRRGLFRRGGLLGLREYPRLRQYACLAGAGLDDSILWWPGTAFCRTGDSLSTTGKPTCCMASSSVCLVMGSVRMVKELAAHRVPLALCWLWRTRFTLCGVDSRSRGIWHLLALGSNRLFRRQCLGSAARCRALGRHRSDHRPAVDIRPAVATRRVDFS